MPSGADRVAAAMDPYHPDAKPAETTEIVLSEYDEGSLSHFHVIEEVNRMFTLEQIKLLRGEVPVESVSFLDWNKENTPAHKRKPLIPYLPLPWYTDSMNCVVGFGNWKLKVLERIDIRAKLQGGGEGGVAEVMIIGQLIIYGDEKDEDGNRKEILAIDCEGGATVKNNPNNCMADFYKIARADAFKNACQWIGLGLKLKDPKFKQQCLDYRAEQKSLPAPHRR